MDNEIESIINQFEALIRTPTESQGTGLSHRILAEYVQLCEDAVDELEQAIRAEA